MKEVWNSSASTPGGVDHCGEPSAVNIDPCISMIRAAMICGSAKEVAKACASPHLLSEGAVSSSATVSRSSQVRISDGSAPAASSRSRSEEHTSELQSRFDLVCRLLLEKKK